MTLQVYDTVSREPVSHATPLQPQQQSPNQNDGSIGDSPGPPVSFFGKPRQPIAADRDGALGSVTGNGHGLLGLAANQNQIQGASTPVNLIRGRPFNREHPLAGAYGGSYASSNGNVQRHQVTANHGQSSHNDPLNAGERLLFNSQSQRLYTIDLVSQPLGASYRKDSGLSSNEEAGVGSKPWYAANESARPQLHGQRSHLLRTNLSAQVSHAW